MVKTNRLAAILCGALLCLPAMVPTEQAQPRHVFETVTYNTVKIIYQATSKDITGHDYTDRRMGSGVLVAPDQVLTCHHLVASYLPGTFTIYITDGITVESRSDVTILKHDLKVDLMLLRIAPPFNETGVRIAAKMPRLADPILFTGYTSLPVTSLRFSQLNANARGIMLFPVYKGDSGGGVFNRDGELIGIIFSTASLQDGEVRIPTFIGYAIPLLIIKEFLDEQ